MTNRVLVAVDGTEASAKALEMACALADNYEANLGLLCVIEPAELDDEAIRAGVHEGVLREPNYGAWNRMLMSTSDAYMEAERGAYAVQVGTAVAEHTVAEAEAYAKDSSAKAIKTFIRSGNVADSIVDVAKANNADLIVMGHDQEGLLKSLIKGSVAEKVVRNAPCPCLVYSHPKAG